MTTGAFSRNVSKLFSQLKLVSDDLLFNDLRIWCGDEGKVLQPCLYRAHFPEKAPSTKLPHSPSSARRLNVTYVQQDLGKL